MHRLLILACAALAIVALSVAPSWAQEFGTFPDYPGLSNNTMTKFPLGPGFYLSWIKILLSWLVFLMWVRSVDWMSNDGYALRMAFRRWDMLAFFAFIAALFLQWVIPWFWLSFPLLLLAWIVPLAVYVSKRNAKVSMDETVFTPGHIRFWLSENLKVIGIKIAAEAGRGKKLPIELHGQGGADDRTNTANELLARQSGGFVLVQEMLMDCETRRADAVLMEFTQASVAMKYQIDGVWHDVDPREREFGDAMLAVMKTLAARNAAERVKRQEGAFAAEHNKVTYTVRLVSQGTKTGERALLQIQGRKKDLDRLQKLDMRPKLIEDLKAVLAQPIGLVVISAPPAGGLSTVFTATVSSMDRYTRGFVGVEATAGKEVDIENVPMTRFDPAAGQSPGSILPKLAREHPDVYIVPDLVDAESAIPYIDQVEVERRMVVTTIRAKEAAESLLRVLMMKIPAAKFAPVVTVAVNQRLIRKLCTKCKEAYAPTPQVLEQLNIPAGRVEAFYRPPQEPEEVCTECQGIGYLGRTAMFEVLIVDDGVRQALTTTPQLAAVRLASRKAGMRTLQEEGIVLVAKGVTSLQELMRVLKE